MIIEEFVTEFLNAALFSSITVAAILFFARIFFKGYIDQKSKNLATKEDVGEITNIVEKIKHENAQVLEKIKAEHAEKLEDIRKENQLLVSSLDKQLDLKIKIYTDALEAFSHVNNSIVKLSNLNFDEFEFTKLLDEVAAKLSKIQAVCSTSTLKSTLKIMEAFNKATLDLLPQRIPLSEDVELQQKKLAELTSGEHTSELLEIKQKELMDLTNKIFKNNLDFTRICFNTHLDLMTLLPEFVLAIRKEMGIDASHKEFAEINEKFLSNMGQSFDEFLKQIYSSNSD